MKLINLCYDMLLIIIKKIHSNSCICNYAFIITSKKIYYMYEESQLKVNAPNCNYNKHIFDKYNYICCNIHNKYEPFDI